MKVLVTGANGQLGSDVVEELSKKNYEVIATDIQDSSVNNCKYAKLDITNETMVDGAISKFSPDAVIHCAAWTAVDSAEEDDNKEKVYNINSLGTKYIANACKKHDCKLMYISTDYIFDGSGTEPWMEDCKNYNPINHYGKTKLDGELAIVDKVDKYFIVRIAWVFGLNGNNFIKTMLKLGKTKNALSIVCDQVGTPTYTLDLARLLVDMISTDKYGYYHVTNDGEYISWYDFAVEIFKYASELGYTDYNAENLCVKAVTTEEYGLSKAKRPKNSRLNRSKIKENEFTPLPNWKDAMKTYIDVIITTI